MDKIIKEVNKLSLPVVILIASLVIGGFYYAGEVNKQKSIERQQQTKIEQEKQDQLKAQQTQEQVKQALDSCLTTADSNYFANWYTECKAQGLLTDRCISLHDMTFDKYAKQNNIPSPQDDADKNLKAMTDFYKEKNECGNCSLPFANGDRISKWRQDAKNECFKQYPQK